MVHTNEVHTDASGRKWIGGKVPYDVFYDDPLAIANNTQQVSTATPTSSGDAAAPAANTASPTAAADAKPAAGGSDDWKAVIGKAHLEAEAKKIRNRLTDSLQSIGKYNGNYKEIQVEGAVLAAIGAIAIEHPEAVSWKANAKHIRDLGGKIEQASQGLGKKPYDETNAAFEQLVSILDGNKPADAGDSADKAPFHEVADRAGLMKRMDRSFNYMKKQVTTDAIFKSSAEEVAHETMLLAAMSKVVSVPGYLSSEEDQYKKHATTLIDACMEMEKAVQEQNFKNFGDALSRVQKKCDECHVDYRFADGS